MMTTAASPTAIHKPIIFSGPMVQALLRGNKTQTRRVVKPQPPPGWDRHCWYDAPVYGWTPETEISATWHKAKCRYGTIGDRLWVRETFALVWPTDIPPEQEQDSIVEYRADTGSECLPGSWPDEEHDNPECPRWRPSIHMPKWASRITLEVTNIRCERLQDISEEDAIAEGTHEFLLGLDNLQHDRAMNLACRHAMAAGEEHVAGIRYQFAAMWDSINGKKHPWKSNPWAFVVEFRRVQP